MTQGPRSQGRVRTIEVAALLHATGSDGRVDPLAFAAQRLILECESLDGVDARALAAALPGAAKGAGLDRRALADAVCSRLSDTAARRVRDAIAGKRRRRKVGALGRLSRQLGWKYWFQPAPGAGTRWPGDPRLRGMTPEKTAEARRRTVKAYKALRGYVDPAAFRAEIRDNEHYRNYIISLVMMYASFDKVQAEHARTGHIDVTQGRATIALNHWRQDWLDAMEAGRGEAFIAETWEIGVDAAVCAMPSADFWKLGGVAQSGLEGIDIDNPAVREATAEAARISRAARNRSNAGPS